MQLMNVAREGRMADTPTEHPRQIDRSWQHIATELSQETNPDSVLNLSEELNRALEENEKRRKFA